MGDVGPANSHLGGDGIEEVGAVVDTCAIILLEERRVWFEIGITTVFCIGSVKMRGGDGFTV